MIRVKDLHFSYPRSGFKLAIDSLSLDEGEKLCIMGQSGSGKTTLINLISGILKPDKGSIQVAGMEISKQNDASIRKFRLSNMGFIFQDFKLLEYLDVRENILLPYRLSKDLVLDKDVIARLALLIDKTGIKGKETSFPDSLSHGEKQRVAVLRALITTPSIVIGDEPTANLDRKNAEGIMDLILNLVQEKKTSFILVTHDISFKNRFDKVIDLERSG